ncbi:hypothetical protein GQ54DRAFT_199487 [Martensiomyces pterosporus]|nr:hypothetical protein GQ54DRAFT_199487 [Martensiomyces pterosporus]
MYGVTLLLVMYCWANNSYAPIRAKNMRITTLMYIGTLLWYIGDLPTNGHVALAGTWSICKLWCIWIRVFFAYAFGAAAALRNYALYRVFILHRPYKGLGFYIPIVVLFGSLVVFSTVSQLVSSKLTVIYSPKFEMCSYVWAFRGSCLALVWVIWLLVLFFVIKIRRIHTSFNERYDSIVVFILGVSAAALTTALHLAYPNYPLRLHLRLLNTWVDFLTGNLAIWAVLLYPCYQSIVNREAYLQSWYATLQADGLKEEYNMSPLNRSVQHTYSVIGEGAGSQHRSGVAPWPSGGATAVEEVVSVPPHAQLGFYSDKSYHPQEAV